MEAEELLVSHVEGGGSRRSFEWEIFSDIGAGREGEGSMVDHLLGKVCDLSSSLDA